MSIVISIQQLEGMSPSTRQEILTVLHQTASSPPADYACSYEYVPGTYRGFDMTGMADLTEGQVDEYMDGLSKAAVKTLRVFAEHGPVITNRHLREAGVRSVSPLREEAIIRLWDITETADTVLISTGKGRYAVTTDTHEMLRRYFSEHPQPRDLRRGR